MDLRGCRLWRSVTSSCAMTKFSLPRCWSSRARRGVSPSTVLCDGTIPLRPLTLFLFRVSIASPMTRNTPLSSVKAVKTSHANRPCVCCVALYLLVARTLRAAIVEWASAQGYVIGANSPIIAEGDTNLRICVACGSVWWYRCVLLLQ